MNFGNELQTYMDKLDCSPKELSKKSGVSPSVISRYLNGKRTPKQKSDHLNKIIDALFEISNEKDLTSNSKNPNNYSKESISKKLKDSLNSSQIDYDVFVSNFNILQNDLKISTVELAKAIGYDPSFLSRIKSKERKASNFDGFIENLANFIVSSCQNSEKKQILASLFDCPLKDLANNEKYKSIFISWITTEHKDSNKNILSFLSKLDTFNLNDYIGTDFNKVKVPTSPVILKNSKTYLGIDGRKKAESNFLKLTLLSKSNEPIFFCSNLPLAEASQDETFKKKWILAMTMVLKKGLHLNMIHNIDRPINEMLVGLENWIPIYMTGSISPYYFVTPPSNLFSGSLCTSGSVALYSECINNDEKKSMFYLTTKKEEIEFAKEKAKVMQSKAKPLMKIYKEENKKEFNLFMKNEKIKYEKDIQTIKKDVFKNIDFTINKNKWIIVNKKTNPEIHFVIYNEKLINAFKTFLLS